MTSIQAILTKKQPEKNNLRNSFLKMFRNGSNSSDKVKVKKEKCKSPVLQDKKRQKESIRDEKERKEQSKSEKGKDKKVFPISKIKSGPSGILSESNVVEKTSPTAKASSSSLNDTKSVKYNMKLTDITKERRKSRSVSVASDDSKSGIPRWKY